MIKWIYLVKYNILNKYGINLTVFNYKREKISSFTITIT